jgi:hypothetical protein
MNERAQSIAVYFYKNHIKYGARVSQWSASTTKRQRQAAAAASPPGAGRADVCRSCRASARRRAPRRGACAHAHDDDVVTHGAISIFLVDTA